MKESIVTGAHVNPNSEEEYLEPDDVEMNNDESGTPYAENIAPVLPKNPEVTLFHHISNNPLLIGPLRWRASNTQEGRNDTEMEMDGASHPERIIPVPPQNTGAGAGTVALFRRNPDSPLFKLGSKRPAEENEEDRNRQDRERKYQMRVNVSAIQLCNRIVG
jgi:hypothetical protein